MIVRLPNEVWALVFSCLPTSGLSRRRLLTACQLFYSLPATEKQLDITEYNFCYLINLLVWEGKLKLVQWAFLAFGVRIEDSFNLDAPLCYAIERGHVELLQYLVEQHYGLENAVRHFRGMYQSVPAAAHAGHKAVVQYVLDTVKTVRPHWPDFASRTVGFWEKWLSDTGKGDLNFHGVSDSRKNDLNFLGMPYSEDSLRIKFFLVYTL